MSKPRTDDLADRRRSLPLQKESSISALLCIGLLLIVLIAFGKSIHYGFVSYDDGDYVYENPRITGGLTFGGVWWAFTHVHAANWHPLTTISHMIDCQLFGLNPWGQHLTNVILHATTTILLFLALRKLTIPLWPAAFVAAVFAIHPLRVESVAWISERKDVLSGVFCMLTLLAYAGYARTEQRSVRRYLTVVLSFALGLLCKPTLVTLPFVLLLLDYWPLERYQKSSIRGLVLEKIPLFLLSAFSCVMTILAQKRAFDTDLNLRLAERISNAALSYAIYLKQMIYPVRLAILYPYGNLETAKVILAMLLLVSISLIFFVAHKKYPFLLVGWLWYLGMLVPMIGLVQVGLQPRADRYTYLPQIGLYLSVACGTAALLARCRWKHSIATGIGLLITIVLTMNTQAQLSYWRNSEVLWEHAIESTSGNYIAYDNLGTLLLRRHQPDAALAKFQAALKIKPDFEDANVSAGSALMLMGRVDQAIDYYQRALQINPNSAEDWSNLATALLRKGETTEALEDYKKAAGLKPQSSEMQYNLGHAFATTGDWANAITCYQAAIRVEPNDAKIRNNLAVTLAQIGKNDEAIEELRMALQIDPNYADAHFNLGSILADLGKREEAAAQLREAVRLRPDYSAAKGRLDELATPK